MKSLVTMLLALIPLQLSALTLPLPKNGGNVVGHTIEVTAGQDRDLAEIGRRYDIGVHEMIEANPDISPRAYLMARQKVVVPREFVLPEPHKGIVINLAELRLYYYPKGKDVVMTYPIGIGRVGWNTPEGTSKVIARHRNPVWRPTKSIKAEMLKQGIRLPDVVPSGRDNPLGLYAIRLGFHQYLIHGTNFEPGVGRRVSSGCIRMFNNDIEELFNAVRVNTPVTILNRPNKIGWSDGEIYLESHKPLSDDDKNPRGVADTAIETVKQAMLNHPGDIDWKLAGVVGSEQRGIPQVIGFVH